MHCSQEKSNISAQKENKKTKQTQNGHLGSANALPKRTLIIYLANFLTKKKVVLMGFQVLIQKCLSHRMVAKSQW